MTPQALLQMLSAVEQGRIRPEEAAEKLSQLPFEDLGHTRVDHHRSLRTGLPEVIYGAGKTAEQTVAIFASLRRDGVDVLATRVSPETAAAVVREHPEAIHNAVARTVAIRASKELRGHVAVVCAGTSDLPVAEEAAVTAETFGAQVSRFYDVGVAGLHRILSVRETLQDADVVIVCAGMEGALPSVVGGLVGVPVIAVPTSVGYGASFGGVTALLGMLNSCSPNVMVVNIDNGFGAAYSATMIARASHPLAQPLELVGSSASGEGLMERREFLKSAAVAGVAAVSGTTAAEAQPTGAAPVTRPQSPDMIYRQLGTTGETVSAIGLGGFHIGKQKDPQESIRLVQTAIDRGITFMDNCWDYNDGSSELRMGEALSQNGYRQKVFLMTKIDGRTKQEYNKQLDQSLARLRTDHIDLVQFHECIRLDDPDRIFAAAGALEAAVEAKQAGKLRYIGFTGHKDPVVHLRMFDMAEQHGFHFDTVQMPVNVMDAHFRSFTKQVIPVAQRQGTGVLAMKTFGDHFILDSGTVQPIEALHYGLTQPVSVVITGIDSMPILDQAIEAAKTFKPLTQAQIDAILSRTVEAAKGGRYELFKISPHFDGTIQNPKWLGNSSLA